MMTATLMDMKVSEVIGMQGVYRHAYNGQLRQCRITAFDGRRIRVHTEKCTAVWIEPEDFRANRPVSTVEPSEELQKDNTEVTCK